MPIENFPSPVHHSSTVVKNENIYFFSDGTRRIIFFKSHTSTQNGVENNFKNCRITVLAAGAYIAQLC